MNAWLLPIKKQLTLQIQQNKLAHALIIKGSKEVGAAELSLWLSRTLLCENRLLDSKNEILTYCGQCKSCHLLEGDTHPDAIVITLEGESHGVDAIRRISRLLEKTAQFGGAQVVSIQDAERMTIAAANALLKTLEEPPEHVKFLLATTDPQKLPVTILSRCLQFNLQALAPMQIHEQLSFILTKEGIPFEARALELLAKYARGSMRDALSLTDQAIAQSGQDIKLEKVQAMLGTVDTSWSQYLLSAIFANDAAKLVATFERLIKQAPDVEKVLDDMLSLCHLVAMTQVLPQAAKLSDDNRPFVEQVAARLSAEEIQVYYQLLLQGKKDIHLATDLTSGFEMVCLRLFAFRPSQALSIDSEKLKKKLNSQLDSKNNADQAENAQSQAVSSSPAKLQTESEPQSKPAAPELQNELPQAEGTDSSDSQQKPDAKLALETSPPVSEDEAELLAQQAFYQDMAESQGFDPDYGEQGYGEQGYAEDFAEQDANLYARMPVQDHEPLASSSDMAQSKLKVEHGLQSGTEQDNPVLAILASRGMTPGETIKDSQEPGSQEPETAESDKRTVGEQGPTELETKEEDCLDAAPVELKPLDDVEVRFAHEVDEWAQLIERSNLAGLGRQLALNGSVAIEGDHIELTVKQEFAHLLNEKSEAELIEVVSQLAPASRFTINKSELTEMAPSDIQKNINVNRQERAEQSIQTDPVVQSLLSEFDGRLVENSITPL